MSNILKDALEGLHTNDHCKYLETLENILMSSDSAEISGIASQTLVGPILQCFEQASDDKSRFLCASCLERVLRLHRQASEVFGEEIVRKVDNLLNKGVADDSLCEKLLCILSRISDTHANVVADRCNGLSLLGHIYDMTLENQRLAILVFEKITAKHPKQEHISAIERVGEFMTHADKKLAHSAVRVFTNIGQVLDLSAITAEIVNQVAIAMLVITDMDSAYRLMQFVNRMVMSETLANYLLEANVDFGLLVEQVGVREQFFDLLSTTLDTIMKLVPAVTDDWPLKDRVLQGADLFAKQVSPFIEKLVIDHVGCEEQCLLLLASCAHVHRLERVREIIPILAGYALVPELVSAVFEVIKKITAADNSVFDGQESILALLRNTDKGKDTPSERFVKVFHGEYSDVRGVPARDVVTVGDLIAVSQWSPWDLWVSETLPKIRSFLKRDLQNEKETGLHDALVRIVNSCRVLLQALHLPHETDPRDSYTAALFLEKTVPITVRCGVETHGTVEAFIADFASIENWYNETYCHVTKDDALRALSADPALSRILPENEIRSATGSKSALLYRATSTPEYKRRKFKIQDKTFAARESFFRGFARSVDNVMAIGSTTPKIEVLDSNTDEPYYFQSRLDDLSEHTSILGLLNDIHRTDPTINVVCDAYARRLEPYLNMPVNAIGMFSHAIALIQQYPLAFPFAMRMMFAQVTSFDVLSALARLDCSLREEIDWPRVKCVVDRQNLWEDGCVVIEKLGTGRCRLDVQFKDEPESVCATDEFFKLFISAFCDPSRNLWRETLGSDANAKELFPTPDADPHTFYILGMTLAKAWSLSCIHRIPISPLFFEVARTGSSVREDIYREIDPDVFELLGDPDLMDGLTLTYPGIESLEMEERGSLKEVTKRNVHRFALWVKKMMIGTELAHEFKRGFIEVLPWNAISVFTNQEISQIFAGELPME